MADRCDPEIFKQGVSLLLIDGDAEDVELCVQKVAAMSGQRVDWHYSGGVAHVLVLGDHAKAMAAVEALEHQMPKGASIEEFVRTGKDMGMRIIRRYALGDRGIYRADEEVPDGTLAVITTGGTNTFIAADRKDPT